MRDEVKLGAGEDVDFKQYEAGMRHLLDTYISAKPSETISNFEDTGLIELIVKLGAGAIDKLPEGIKKDPEAVAETITNNMRKVIIDERPLNPKYYDRMSELLDAILEERRKGALDYKAYLEQAARTRRQARQGRIGHRLPGLGQQRRPQGPRRLLRRRRRAGQRRSTTPIVTTKPDSWVGNTMKEKTRQASHHERNFPMTSTRLDELFELVKARHEYH